MGYIESRTPSLREIHSIYSNDISDFICNMADLKDLQRIANINKNEGVELSKFNTFPFRYSRLDHSFGVAIILENFRQSKKSIVQAMLHEIAKPSFSFSAKYLKKYFELNDFDEPTAFDKIVGSDYLFEKIFVDDVSASDINNFKKCSIGFAEFPKLSANNLEYVLTNGFCTRTCDIREIADLYNNIFVGKNENNEDEFVFSDLMLARKFFKLSLEIGKKNRSYEAKITKQLISDVLMLMIRREMVDYKDLFEHSDKEIADIGRHCTDKRIKEGWEQIESLHEVYTKFSPTNDVMKYCVKVDEISFYIDPLIKTRMGTFRLSEIDESVAHEIEFYKETDTDMYMYIDYEL